VLVGGQCSPHFAEQAQLFNIARWRLVQAIQHVGDGNPLAGQCHLPAVFFQLELA
jgi:hypothetical protein